MAGVLVTPRICSCHLRLAGRTSLELVSHHRSPHLKTSHGIHTAALLTPATSPAALLHVSAGCGVVSFACHESAAAAMEALNKKHTWPDSEAPMVVEWVDPSRQAATKQRSSSSPGMDCTATGCYRVLPVTVPSSQSGSACGETDVQPLARSAPS
jgi:hypothetical protein